MGWIKRNLFLVIGGVLTLGFLGAAGYYIYSSVSRNTAASAKLDETYGTLKNLSPQPGKPGPGNDKINNTQIAKDQESQLHQWMLEATNYFKPIAPIPARSAGSVTSQSYANALHHTLDQLQHEAENASVALPPKYSFSFEQQLSEMKFNPAGLEPLAAQLGEVKAISETLFAAGINSLDSVQRVRVAEEDSAGSPSDYIDDHPVTNELAIVTPYVVTFRAFSPEIAQVLAGFASSPHGFFVKGINVQPSGSAAAPDVQPPSGMPGPGFREGGTAGAAPPGSMPVKGGLQTVLKEQLLRATVEVEVVKLISPAPGTKN